MNFFVYIENSGISWKNTKITYIYIYIHTQLINRICILKGCIILKCKLKMKLSISRNHDILDISPSVKDKFGRENFNLKRGNYLLHH